MTPRIALVLVAVLASLSSPARAGGVTGAATGTGSTAGGATGTGDIRPYPLYQLFYKDSDGDGHGNPRVFVKATSQPAGYAKLGDDCNDADAAVHPGAKEACNGVDDDCDLVADEGLPVFDWFRDADVDGFGDPDVWEEACAAPDGFVADDSDCDDDDSSVHPGADEVCNGVDDDCDGGSELEVLWGGHTYLFCYLPEVEENWHDGRIACQDVMPGMDLVKVDDVEEHAFLLGVWQTIRYESEPVLNHRDREEYVAWIGLSDAGSEGTFFWTDWTLPFEGWCDGEPNNAGPENYAVMGWTSNYGDGSHCDDEWNDLDGEEAAPFICENGF